MLKSIINSIWFWLIFSIGLFTGLASWNITRPGLYYDELIFVNAALGGNQDFFIFKSFFGIPIMLMPYIGALKAWMYTPIFNIFEVNAYTIRLPVIFLGAVSLLLTFLFARKLFNTKVAVASCLLASVEPSLLFHTRLDWGPTALMTFFKGTLLLGLAYFICDKKRWSVFLILFSVLLGVYDKLNFIWVFNAACVSVAIFYRKELFEFKKKYPVTSLSAFIMILSGLSLYVIYVYLCLPLAQEIVDVVWQSRLEQMVSILKDTFGGTGVYSFIIGDAGNLKLIQLSIIGITVLLSFSFWAWSGFQHVKRVACWILFSFTLIMQMYITKRATGPHHAVMLSPLWITILAAMLFSDSKRGRGARADAYQRLVGTIAVCCLFVSSLFIDIKYLQGFNGTIRNVNWDPGSYALKEFVAHYHNDVYLCIDWGIATVLDGLMNGKVRCYDSWPWFKEPMTADFVHYIEERFISKSPIALVRAAGAESFPQTRKNFFEIATARSWQIKLLFVISGSNGRALIEAYKVTLT